MNVLLVVLFSVVSGQQQNDPAANQMVYFKNITQGPIGVITTSSGAPVYNEDARSTLNKNLLDNEYFMDSLFHLMQERIVPRVIYAKGAGAFGYFETTHNMSHICEAKMFSEVGKKTPIAARFSTLISERGGVDTSSEARGFSLKFYTEEGNFDIVGSNTPMFVSNEPLAIMAFIKAIKRNPATDLIDLNMIWDVLTLNPEMLYTFLLIHGDEGIPDGYRHMPGYSVQTYEVCNKDGKKSYIRFHFSPNAGIKNLNVTEAGKIAATSPDYATKDLYNAIANKENPSWQVSLQILSQKDVSKAKKSGLDVFDISKVLPLDLYPLHPVGRITLTRNPKNYFGEIEQLAFNPSNLIKGILGCPGKVYQTRRLAYREAHSHRLGGNYNKIQVNCPFQNPALTYNRNGVPPVEENEKDTPNYYPNSFNGPIPIPNDKNRPVLSVIHEERSNNFDQAADRYKQMTSAQKVTLVTNILTVLCPVTDFVKQRAVKGSSMISHDLASRISEGLASQC